MTLAESFQKSIKKIKKKIINIFGDSHCKYFSLNSKLRFHFFPLLKNIKANVFLSLGASIKGLGRRKSTLGIDILINDNIKNDESLNIFAYGQVDIELGYYYTTIIKKEKINQKCFIRELVERYIDFILKLDLDRKNIIIKGINLTVLKFHDFGIEYVYRIISENIDDKNLRNKYFLELSNHYGSFEERNKMIIEFNQLLSKKAFENDLKYFDINSDLCDGNMYNGVIDKFIPAVEDHHLIDSIDVRKMHWNRLCEILSE